MAEALLGGGCATGPQRLSFTLRVGSEAVSSSNSLLGQQLSTKLRVGSHGVLSLGSISLSTHSPGFPRT